MSKEIKLGEGSIRTIEAGRKYAIRFQLPDGSKSPQRTIRGTKADAKKARADYRDELELKLNSVGTFAQYARAFHEERKTLGQLSQGTLRKDEQDIRRIEEYFPDILLEELKSDDIKAVLIKTKSELTPYLHYRLYDRIRQVLKDAFDKDMIQTNPIKKVPKIKKPTQKIRRSLTKDQAKYLSNLLLNSDKSGYKVAIFLALKTGMRHGELQGLQWKNVDFEDLIITVDHQYTEEDSEADTKTPYSVRTIPIGQTTANYLLEWKDQVQKEIFKGEKIPNNYPVCISPYATTDSKTAHFKRTTFSDWRRSFFIANQITYELDGEEHPYDLHELRHTFATLMAPNTDIKTLQYILGHSDIATTLKIYTHIMEENKRRVGNVIDQILE